MSVIYKGVLIAESVENSVEILKSTKVVGSRKTKLEGESFRGVVTFYNIDVEEHKLWVVLEKVAQNLKTPGWYFHLVNKDRLYIVLPRAILFAANNKDELDTIVQFAESQGIHPKQLNLKQLFDNPYV